MLKEIIIFLTVVTVSADGSSIMKRIPGGTIAKQEDWPFAVRFINFIN